MAAVLLALVAGLIFGLGTVLEQREAMTLTDSEDADPLIVIRLARRPVWLAGVGCYLLGYLVQATALASGRLVVVQPILATSIVFALPLGAWLSAQRISRRDVIAAFAVIAGLAAFLAISDPGGGRDDAPFDEWAIAGAILIAATALFARAGLWRSGAIRAALLGTAAGLLFALVSALTKGAVEGLTDNGVAALLGDWHLYSLIAIGFAGLTLTQLALKAGVLAPAIASTSIVNPAVSVVLGVTLFDETLHHTALGSIASGFALLVMFGGIVALANSRRPDS